LCSLVYWQLSLQNFVFKERSDSHAILMKKAILVAGLGGQQGCETSRLPHFLYTRLIVGCEVSALRAGRLLPTRKIPGT
jgi:hypothetical protein